MFNILLPSVTLTNKVNDIEDTILLLKLPLRIANLINIANSITITETGAVQGAVHPAYLMFMYEYISQYAVVAI